MLNNRLEDLIYKYKNYRIKRFKNLLKFLLFIAILVGGTHSIYTKLKEFKNAKVKDEIKNTLKKEKTEKKESLIKEKKVIKPIIIKVEKKKSIDEEKILKKQSLKTLLMLEKRKPTYETAYDLGKYYFDNRNFQLASKWATVASNREPKHAKAWILYAKSKIKLGQTGMAKKALKIYLLKYRSREVSNLLNSL